MFRFLIYVHWQTKIKNMSRLSFRHCSRLYKLRSRTCKLKKEKVSFCKAWTIKRKAQSIKNCSLPNFNRAQSPQKRLGFQSNTTKYKKKTPNKFQKFLEVIFGGTTIWLLTATLKISLRGVMSNAINDLSVSSSSPIGFEMEWHSSRSNKWYRANVMGLSHGSVIVREELLGGP